MTNARIRLFALGLGLAATTRAQTSALPPQLEQQFETCVQAQKAGKLDMAEKCLLDLIAKGGKASFVLNNLGIVYQQKSEHNRAIARFREAISLEEDYGAPHYLLGISLLAIGRDSGAVSELARAVQLLPEKNRARIALAQAYERTGDLLGAVDERTAVSDAHPQDPEPLYQLARAHQKLAALCFERMKQVNPASARVYQVLGESEIIQGHTDRAIEAFRKAAEADPKLAGSHLALSFIFAGQGRTKEAIDETIRELAVAPESAAALGLQRKLQSSQP